MQSPKEILKDFVEGNLSNSGFEKEIYSNTELEELLSKDIATENMNLDGLSNPYYYLIEQDYKNAGAILNIHDICSKVLIALNVPFKPTKKHEEFYDLLLTTQPKYLDIEVSFFEKYIYKPEYDTLTKSEKKKKIKAEIKGLFQYEIKAPIWIQNPEWIVEDNTPLFFLGQYEMKNSSIFKDNGFVYLLY